MTFSTTIETIESLEKIPLPSILSEETIEALSKSLLENLTAEIKASSTSTGVENAETEGFTTLLASPIGTNVRKGLAAIAKQGDLSTKDHLFNAFSNGLGSSMLLKSDNILANHTFRDDAIGKAESNNFTCNCSRCKTAREFRDDTIGRAEFNTSNIGGDSGNPRKWAQPGGKGSAVDITYAFANNFDIPGLSTTQAKTLFNDSLELWATYAPLNFQEVADPGNGQAVDIRVDNQFIDGPRNTLAFAYFPGGGDITFDSGDTWNESLYLETTVHELGHSLGLAHEEEEEAILNPIIANRFAGGAEPFLLQDDIDGIRFLYGDGVGSVTPLGQSTPAPQQQPVPEQQPEPQQQPAPLPTPLPTPNNPQSGGNLVTNGSFENSPVRANSFGVFTRVNGWRTLSGSGLQIDKRNQFGGAAEGSAWAELDSYNNSEVAQDIDTLTGQTYALSFEYSPRQGLAANTNGIQVLWDGEVLDTITGNGRNRNRNRWRSYSFEVEGGNGDNSRLSFKAVGRNDQVGGFIDDVVVKRKAGAQQDLAAATDDYGLGISDAKEDAFISSGFDVNAMATNTDSGAFNPIA